MNRRFILFLLLFGPTAAFAWGPEGHRLITLNGIRALPLTMSRFREADFHLADRSFDVDRRKLKDEEVVYREFIQLERYPEALAGRMPSTKLELEKRYGKDAVRLNGTLPYHILDLIDSLHGTMKNADWPMTLAVISDLGYYVSELSNPLRVTMNYDGQYTHNNGIRWRYENELMNRYYPQMMLRRLDPPKFADPKAEPFARIMNLALKSQSRLVNILRRDTMAFRIAKNSYSSTYYSTMWKELGPSMTELVQESVDLYAALIYNVWLEAGGTKIPWRDQYARRSLPAAEPEHLGQNYPNPFTGRTTIPYVLKENANIRLAVYTVFGQELMLLMEGRQGPGQFEAQFNAEHLSDGTYFVRLQIDDRTEVRKMILAK